MTQPNEPTDLLPVDEADEPAEPDVPDEADSEPLELIDAPVADPLKPYPPNGKPTLRLSPDRIRKVVDYYIQMVQPSFVEAMVRGGGYTLSTARATGFKFKRRPDVQAMLAERRAVIGQQMGVTTEMLVERLKMIAFSDLSRFIKITRDGELNYDFTGATETELKLINELTVDKYTEGRGVHAKAVKKFKFAKADTLRAIELLGRILGAFKDKTEVSGEISLVERLQRGREQARAAKGVKLIAQATPAEPSDS